MELEFWKLSGAGNDFIAIDNLTGIVPEEGRAARIARWCRRGTDVGADGVLLIEPPQSGGHFRMRYYNADGSEGETCGNGSRCIARFALLRGVAPLEMQFETIAGPYHAKVEEETVSVGITDAFGYRGPIRIDGDAFEGECHFLNTGVPHVVVEVEDVAAVRVFEAGRFLRHHAEFQPAGANINFVQVRNPHELAIRTYERGVENETLACGTGSVAAAIVMTRLGLAEAPVRLQTASGEYVETGFTPAGDGARNVTLRGGARVVFRGYLPDENF